MHTIGCDMWAKNGKCESLLPQHIVRQEAFGQGVEGVALAVHFELEL